MIVKTFLLRKSLSRENKTRSRNTSCVFLFDITNLVCKVYLQGLRDEGKTFVSSPLEELEDYNSRPELVLVDISPEAVLKVIQML